MDKKNTKLDIDSLVQRIKVIKLQQLKNEKELSNILASEIINKILDKSKVKKNKSGGITIRLSKE